MSTRYIFLIFFIFQIHLCAFADHKTDSLLNIVQEYEKKEHFESDTNYIKTLINLALLYANPRPDSSLFFSNKSFELSVKYGYPNRSLTSSSIMATIYMLREDAQQLLQIGTEMLPIAEKIDRKALSRVYSILGAAYYYKSMTDVTYFYQAKEMLQKALDISEEFNDTGMIINALSNISNIYVRIFDYSSAVESLYRAIGIAERSGDETGNHISIMFYNVASIYYEQKEYDKALIGCS